MFDGFWYGIFAGVFGPAIAQWLSRFRYWLIFTATFFGWQFIFFAMAIFYRGWNGLTEIFVQEKSTFIVIFLLSPMAFGGIGALVAFLGSLNLPKKNDNEESK